MRDSELDTSALEKKLQECSNEDLRAITGICRTASPDVHTLMSCANAMLLGVLVEVLLARRRTDGVVKAFKDGGNEAVGVFLAEFEDEVV